MSIDLIEVYKLSVIEYFKINCSENFLTLIVQMPENSDQNKILSIF